MSDARTLRASLERAPRGVLAAAFYHHLFAAHPELESLFNTDPRAMEMKFEMTLRSIIDALDRSSDMEQPLHELGARHSAYGVRKEHYAMAGKALLAALRETQPETWSVGVEDAWSEAYAWISAQMTTPLTPTGK